MKKIIFLSIIISIIMGSCTQEKKSPVEGAWKLIWAAPKTYTDTSFQTMVKTGQIKMFSKDYFTFVGHGEENDTVYYEGYGAGTYTLNGDKYEEHIMYHNNKSLIGTKYKALDEIRNDTLFHRYNSDKADSWELRKDYSTEIYVRLK